MSANVSHTAISLFRSKYTEWSSGLIPLVSNFTKAATELIAAIEKTNLDTITGSITSDDFHYITFALQEMFLPRHKTHEATLEVLKKEFNITGTWEKLEIPLKVAVKETTGISAGIAVDLPNFMRQLEREVLSTFLTEIQDIPSDKALQGIDTIFKIIPLGFQQGLGPHLSGITQCSNALSLRLGDSPVAIALQNLAKSSDNLLQKATNSK